VFENRFLQLAKTLHRVVSAIEAVWRVIGSSEILAPFQVAHGFAEF